MKKKAVDANVYGSVRIDYCSNGTEGTIAAQLSKHCIKWLWLLPWNGVINFQKVSIVGLNSSPQSVWRESFNLAVLWVGVNQMLLLSRPPCSTQRRTRKKVASWFRGFFILHPLAQSLSSLSTYRHTHFVFGRKLGTIFKPGRSWRSAG